MAQTFKNGDPSFAGPLAGIALGLESYHIFELKKYIPEDIDFEDITLTLAQEIDYSQLKSAIQETNEICILNNR